MFVSSADEDIYSLFIRPKRHGHTPRQDIEDAAGSGPFPLHVYAPHIAAETAMTKEEVSEPIYTEFVISAEW